MSGRYALRRLQASGRLIERKNRRTRQTHTFMRRPPVERDVTVDQYFTVVSRYEPATTSRGRATRLARSRRLNPRPVTNQRGSRVAQTSIRQRQSFKSQTSTKISRFKLGGN